MDGVEPHVETVDLLFRANTESLQRDMRAASALGQQFAGSLSRAFEGVAIKGKSLRDVFKGLALDLSRMVLKSALKPLEEGLGNVFSGLMSGGGFRGAGSGFPAMPAAGLPVPFAKGGVIQSPAGFPLAGGRMGLAGERGAEAILPLGRSADGRLGVVSQGGSGVSVTLNVTTPDAESFARSESQVAAMLARAVSSGQRNL